MTNTFLIRPIEPSDNAAMAAIIRSVMPEFGADGPGFAIHDTEVDTMYQAYAQPRCSYFVVERDGVVIGGGGIAPLEGGEPEVCELRKMYLRGARARLHALLPGNTDRHGCGAGAVQAQRFHRPVQRDGRHRPPRLRPLLHPRAVR